MKTLICEKPYELKYKERSRPTPNAGEALVKILSVGICGTDIHAYTGNQPFFTYPRVLGHELCGTIEETGR
ncbi:alcohol dehydrogenase catalytic domain-containing protein [Vibrio sp. CDRSL-10 TSBA]